MVVRVIPLLLVAGLLCASPARADRVDDLSRALSSDPSWRVRLQAVVVLGKLGDAHAQPALLHALGDSNETVRGLAAQVLGDLGDATAVVALERACRDPNPFVREKATAALGRLHPSSVAEAPIGGALHVEVGGIGSKARNTPPELIAYLRNLMERELMRSPGLTMSGKPISGFLIDSAITTMSRKTTDSFVEISCEVSFTVGKLPSKAMVMMTSGGATVQAPRMGLRPAQEIAFQKDALEGAVKGAHENLMAFLRTQQPVQTAGRAVRR